MTTLMRGYLSNLGRHLRLNPPEEREILDELQTHIEERTQELIDAGAPPDEALTRALNHLGAFQGIANQFYEVHSRGSFYHTLLAALPHLLIALMFALHMWTRPALVVVMLLVALSISVAGWRKGRPRWTYPWLGYCLVVPIVSWGLAVGAVGYGAWAIVTQGRLPLSVPIYAASFAYVAFSLWVVIKIVSRVAQQDWLMASLAVLPVPFFAYWFFYFYGQGEAFRSDGQSLRELDSSVAVVFLILAAATAIFFRIGRRLVRVAILLITAPSIVVLAWLSYQGGPGYMAAFTFSAISLAALLSPMLFDLKDNRANADTA